MYDAIIIGAGMSGLAAGIRLAYYDRKVCILERHTTIGGLNSFYRLRSRNYDVGLHAVTNYTDKEIKRGPLAKVLRQLRMRRDDFALRPQIGSEIAFPDVRLRFGNKIDQLQQEITEKFPAESDNFQQMLGRVLDYDELDQETFELSARDFLAEQFRDPLLIEMLLCPLMWYGNARERDMDFGQFCIMFRSIFMEGFARPWAGIRPILKQLVRKFRGLGGELKLRRGVSHIESDGDRATSVVLDNGERLEGRVILSSAGWAETMRLCDEVQEVPPSETGQLSFVESTAVLDRQPRDVGYSQTITFFNDSQQFHWQRPQEELCDVRTGVICSPNNYKYTDEEGDLKDGVMRVTTLANYDRWNDLSEEQYALEKIRWYDRIAESAVRFVPDFRGAVIDTDVFTPTTIRRFTWHDGGAVYGAPRKRLDGKTHLENLYLCGTDQGYVGIIGSMMSGVSMANRCLQEVAQ